MVRVLLPPQLPEEEKKMIHALLLHAEKRKSFCLSNSLIRLCPCAADGREENSICV
jgi:hypothetical protein